MIEEKFIALVPMKGHSERIPNKNLKLINGRPLFFWIINALNNSKYISKIVINTDSEKIASECQKFFKVTIHMRSQEICGDDVGIMPIISEDIAKVDGNFFIQTHSTNPILTTKTIDKAIKSFYKSYARGECDSMFSVEPIQERYYYKDLRPINHNPAFLLRTQDMEPIYRENSCFYIFSRDSALNADNRIGINPKVFEMNKLESIDIDNPADFKIAEFFLKEGI